MLDFLRPLLAKSNIQVQGLRAPCCFGFRMHAITQKPGAVDISVQSLIIEIAYNFALRLFLTPRQKHPRIQKKELLYI